MITACGATGAENLPAGFPQILFLPQVAYRGRQRLRIIQIRPLGSDLLFTLSPIKEDHSAPSAGQRFRPYFQIAIFPHAPALAAEGILVDRDHFLVGQDVVNLRLHVAQVVACDQGGGQECPEAEVGAIFVGRSCRRCPLRACQDRSSVRDRRTSKSRLPRRGWRSRRSCSNCRVPILFAGQPVLDVARCPPQVAADFFAP